MEQIKDYCEKDLLKVEVPRERRIFLKIKSQALKDVIQYLTESLNFGHLSTITGSDMDDRIALIYHLTWEGSITLSLKIVISKEKPEVPTITDVIPGAVIYEREVHDMLGVTFEGHPNLSRLLLPEGWPKDVYPLKKEYKLEELQKLTEPKR